MSTWLHGPYMHIRGTNIRRQKRKQKGGSLGRWTPSTRQGGGALARWTPSGRIPKQKGGGIKKRKSKKKKSCSCGCKRKR